VTRWCLVLALAGCIRPVIDVPRDVRVVSLPPGATYEPPLKCYVEALRAMPVPPPPKSDDDVWARAFVHRRDMFDRDEYLREVAAQVEDLRACLRAIIWQRQREAGATRPPAGQSKGAP